MSVVQSESRDPTALQLKFGRWPSGHHRFARSEHTDQDGSCMDTGDIGIPNERRTAQYGRA
jgi:hypothetical protein